MLEVSMKRDYHEKKGKYMGALMDEKIKEREARKKELAKKRKVEQRKKVVGIQMIIIVAIILLMVLAGVAALADKVSENRGNSSQSGEQADNGGEDKKGKEEITITPTPQEIQPVESTVLTVSLAGDCTIGADKNANTSKNLNAYYNKYKDFGYFFKNVKSIFEADDLTIVNMEGTLTELDTRQDKKFAFKGIPEYAQILVEGDIEAANLANNHSKDYGAQSYTDTIANLENAGVATFGYDRTVVMDVKGVKVGLIGIYELALHMGCQEQLLENINIVKDQGAQIIIVSFHWGVEREYYPNDTQKTLAHLAIDNGADLVVGHHPHVLQGIEEYKGKNIVYSLGNFCFGGNNNPSDKNTMIFQQTFTIENGELVEDNVKNIIPCCLSSTWDYNDYCPTPLTGDEAERVLNKIEQYSKGLSQ